MALREWVTARMAAPPEEVFGLVTNPWLLPSWNRAITEVTEAPEHLEPGSVWKVRLRSQTDDGNPSYADWEWHVKPEREEGSKVTVELHPTTFLRKHVLIKFRRPALRKEMGESLNALNSATSS
jgi:uncharacterized protein YndB with AHSA1/START domain